MKRFRPLFVGILMMSIAATGRPQANCEKSLGELSARPDPELVASLATALEKDLALSPGTRMTTERLAAEILSGIADLGPPIEEHIEQALFAVTPQKDRHRFVFRADRQREREGTRADEGGDAIDLGDSLDDLEDDAPNSGTEPERLPAPGLVESIAASVLNWIVNPGQLPVAAEKMALVRKRVGLE